MFIVKHLYTENYIAPPNEGSEGFCLDSNRDCAIRFETVEKARNAANSLYLVADIIVDEHVQK